MMEVDIPEDVPSGEVGEGTKSPEQMGSSPGPYQSEEVNEQWPVSPQDQGAEPAEQLEESPDSPAPEDDDEVAERSDSDDYDDEGVTEKREASAKSDSEDGDSSDQESTEDRPHSPMEVGEAIHDLDKVSNLSGENSEHFSEQDDDNQENLTDTERHNVVESTGIKDGGPPIPVESNDGPGTLDSNKQQESECPAVPVSDPGSPDDQGFGSVGSNSDDGMPQSPDQEMEPSDSPGSQEGPASPGSKSPEDQHSLGSKSPDVEDMPAGESEPQSPAEDYPQSPEKEEVSDHGQTDSEAESEEEEVAQVAASDKNDEDSAQVPVSDEEDAQVAVSDDEDGECDASEEELECDTEKPDSVVERKNGHAEVLQGNEPISDEEDDMSSVGGYSDAESGKLGKNNEDDDTLDLTKPGDELKLKRQQQRIVSSPPVESAGSPKDARTLDDHGELDYDDDEGGHMTRVKPVDEEKEDGEEDEEEEGEHKSGDESTDGEIDDDDCEEGEIKEPDGRRPYIRPICRFFQRGNCTWGASCRFLHPGINDKGNYTLIELPYQGNMNVNRGPVKRREQEQEEEELPPPPEPEEPKVESAWERGLRHAKELRKKANKRKEQETNLQEKRLYLSFDDERDFNKENDLKKFKDPYYDQADYEDDDYYSQQAKQSWGGGQYENFEVRYTREPDYPPSPPPIPRYRHRSPPSMERDFIPDRRRDRYRSPPDMPMRLLDERRKARPEPPGPGPAAGPGDHWHDPWSRLDKNREDVRLPLEKVPRDDAPRSGVKRRGDEWRDPWQRTKSPKKRRDSSSRSRSPRGRGRIRRRTHSRGSFSSTYSSSFSGSSRSRSRSSSYDSYSDSSRSSSSSGSRSPVRRRPGRRPPIQRPSGPAPAHEAGRGAPPARSGPAPAQARAGPGASPVRSGPGPAQARAGPAPPPSRSGAEKPPVRSGPEKPPSRSGSEKPLARSGPEKPSPRSAQDKPLARSGPEKLPPRSGPDKPPARSGPEPPPARAAVSPAKKSLVHGPQPPPQIQAKTGPALPPELSAGEPPRSSVALKRNIKSPEKKRTTPVAAAPAPGIKALPSGAKPPKPAGAKLAAAKPVAGKLPEERGRKKERPGIRKRRNTSFSSSSESSGSRSSSSDSSDSSTSSSSSGSADSDHLYRDMPKVHKVKLDKKTPEKLKLKQKEKEKVKLPVAVKKKVAKIPVPGNVQKEKIKPEPIKPAPIKQTPPLKPTPPLPPMGPVAPAQILQAQLAAAPKSSKDPLKVIGTKSSIKLTLAKKAPPEKQASKRSADSAPVAPPSKKIKEMEPARVEKERPKSEVKPKAKPAQPATPAPTAKPSAKPVAKKVPAIQQKPAPVPQPAAAQPPPVAKAAKKSSTSRREELLKQLKAVEDAIARKRKKMN